jgi:hypothetical protein
VIKVYARAASRDMAKLDRPSFFAAKSITVRKGFAFPEMSYFHEAAPPNEGVA